MIICVQGDGADQCVAGAPRHLSHSRLACRWLGIGTLRRRCLRGDRRLVELVSALREYPSAAEAIDALVPRIQRAAYTRALSRLADSEVIDVR